MCVSRGAPRKPAYGPCNEQHGLEDLMGAMVFMVTLGPVLSLMESALKSQMKKVAVCV